MKFLRALLVLALVLGLGACKTTTIYNVHRASFGISKPATDEAIERAIIEAGRRKGWAIKPVEPGKMRGVLSKRRHVAVVAITYSGTDFSIQYLDSTNLKHDGDSIHKAYNKWVKELEVAIQREAMFRLQ